MQKEDNGKTCRWSEVVMNRYGDRVEKVFCHLKPESKRVDMWKDCVGCPHHAVDEEDKIQ